MRLLVAVCVALATWWPQVVGSAAIRSASASGVIALDSGSPCQNHSGSGSNPLTVACTIAGANEILFAFSMSVHGGSTGTTATFNSVSMTAVTNVTFTSGFSIYAFCLANPATGSNTLSMAADSEVFGLVAAAYSGANQSCTVDATNTGTAGTSATSLAVSTTTVTVNDWIAYAVASNDGGTGLTAGTGATSRVGFASGGSGFSQGLFDSNAALTIGAHSLTANDATGASMTGVTIAFAPSPGPAPFLPAFATLFRRLR